MYYVGTFISGFEKYIEKLLKEKLNDIKIIEIFNGLIIFKTNNLEKLPFLNNIYLLLNKTKIQSTDINKNIKQVINNFNFDYNYIKNIIKNKNISTFKIKVYKENQPTSFNYKTVFKLENDIKNKLKLKISNTPNIEFVIQERREGFVLFMLKLTTNRLTEKNILKGSLRPEMSYLLVSLANLNSSDIVLDPFFGHGSIPKTIVKYFKYNMCFATEIDTECVKNLKQEYKNNNKKLFIKEKNVLNLDCFEDNFINVIITDPPWNIYNKNDSIDYVEFYKKMLDEFYRILSRNGKAIILMGNQIDFEKSLNDINKFTINDIISILVNGKKANIYYLIKK